MPEWKTTSLGNVAEIFDGPHATPTKTETGPWFLSISSLKQGQLDLSESAHLSDEDFQKWTRRVTPREGDVLFSYETRLGEAALMPTGIQACLGRRMGLLRPTAGMADSRFLLYAYLGPEFQQTIRERSIHGATVDRIPLVDLPDWPIRLPSLQEQKTIARLLGALDDKVAVNGRISETARNLARAHFHAVQESQDPEDVDLASVVEFLNRGPSPRYTEDRSQLRVLNQKCIRDGRVCLAPSRRTLSDKVPGGKMLRPHDVLVNSTGMGTLGRVARWTREEACTVDSHVTIVRFDPAKVDPVCAGFAMLDAEPEIESLGQGSTGQTELGRAQLSALRITVPSRERAVRLRPSLDALEERGDFALEESLSLAELRNTLLPRLMSGEIRVRDAEKAVEEVT
ncbi:MAG: restriction endonuclease subunit S [Streptosporangiaceae bacterium]